MKSLSRGRVKAKTRLQYEAAECGAAALATILDYFGCHRPLSELRQACCVGRDGSNARQLVAAAKRYGLDAKAYRRSGKNLADVGQFPCIVYWSFRHFLVVEGFNKTHAFLSDPAQGRLRVSIDEFLDEYTGIVIECAPGSGFKRDGKLPSPLAKLPEKLWPYRHSIGVLLLLASAQGLIALLVAGLTSSFIDGFLQGQRSYFGIPIIWLLLLVVVGWLALLTTQFVILRRLEFILSKRLTADLFRKLFQVTFGFHQARIPGEVASRMLLGLQTTQVVVAQLIRFLISIWIGVLVLLISILVSAWLATLVIVIMLGNILLNWWLTDLRYDANRKLAIDQGKAQGKGLQGINNIETIKASGLEFDFLSQWQGSFGSAVNQSQLLGSQMAGATIAANGSTFLLNALVIALGGLLIIDGRLSLGTLVAFQFLQGQLTAPISTLPQLNSALQLLIGALGRLDDLEDNPDDPYVQSFSIQLLNQEGSADIHSESRLQGSVQLSQVSFSFDRGSTYFLKDLNLAIPQGSQISIVGKSGSGKSTLIRLIAGLHQPTSGNILFDGKTWDQHGNKLMHSSIAYVPQQVFVFNATIYDNITLWNPDYSLSEVEDAARDAQILNTINAHPESFKRRLKDNGSDLSGGERQRLEICRAILRKPTLLLLDEATSALDNATESRVYDSLKQRAITLITIAHRLDVALKSDQVIVMSNGAIAEAGQPEQLLRQGGLFASLVNEEGAKQ